jgi:hypothetical protein
VLSDKGSQAEDRDELPQLQCIHSLQ